MIPSRIAAAARPVQCVVAFVLCTGIAAPAAAQFEDVPRSENREGRIEQCAEVLKSRYEVSEVGETIARRNNARHWVIVKATLDDGTERNFRCQIRYGELRTVESYSEEGGWALDEPGPRRPEPEEAGAPAEGEAAGAEPEPAEPELPLAGRPEIGVPPPAAPPEEGAGAADAGTQEPGGGAGDGEDRAGGATAEAEAEPAQTETAEAGGGDGDGTGEDTGELPLATPRFYSAPN